jgi:hypothetical protein
MKNDVCVPSKSTVDKQKKLCTKMSRIRNTATMNHGKGTYIIVQNIKIPYRAKQANTEDKE